MIIFHNKKINICFFILLIFCSNSFSQTTTIQGIVKDSITGEPVSYVTVQFDHSSVGDNTDNNGKFKLSNKQGNNVVVFSLIGYDTKKITIPAHQTTVQEILMSPAGISLNEIEVRPGKEKYSKKNNPAVDLITKVIERKNDYLISNQKYYSSKEYDRLIFAFNEFDSTHFFFKQFEFLPEYIAKSRIDEKTILPISVRETLSDFYHRKDPKTTRKVIKGRRIEGIDQGMNTETIDGVVEETFTNILITDNNIHLLQHDFVGPLNSLISTSFYKWYIIDTVTIDQKKYIDLGFVPFNSRDAGFSGHIYITSDSTYAIKKLSFRVPRKTNLNFVDEMIIEQEFEQLSPTVWAPLKFTTAIDLSVQNILKMHIEKVKSFDDYSFEEINDTIFAGTTSEIYLPNYKKRSDEYWNENRPAKFNQDYHMDSMMAQMRANKFVNAGIKTMNILSSSYFPTSKNEEKNKVDIGTLLTFYSYNSLEKNRFRITAATNKNFHPRLFLYGYLAYGTGDNKFKYRGEATWSFNKKEYHKDEFPRNNLSASYKYDINSLGQLFLQSERDNILLSGSNRKDKLTYARMVQLNYIKEYHNGFSFNILGTTETNKPAMNIDFEVYNESLNVDTIYDLKTTQLELILRYAHNEKFFQRRRERNNLPSKGFIYTLSLSSGTKGLSGQYEFNKLSFAVSKQFWVPPVGRIYTNLQLEKVWGKVPYPLLLSANANSSYTIQKLSFNLLEPMEFLSDTQLSWEIYHRMGGFLLNRIPLIRRWKWREVQGFRGFFGSLSKRNNPIITDGLMIFPANTYSMRNTPYMEYSIGIENIFQILRVDYVRRLTYLDNIGAKKGGFRFSLNLSF